MDKFYIPISSKSFNNIFDTESISPESFYSQRGFGIPDIYLPTELPNNKDFIILYTTPFKFKVSSEISHSYPMWLEIELDKTYLHPIDDKAKIFASPATIYFFQKKFRCLFSNPTDLKNTIENTKHYLGAKLLPKYQQFLEVVPNFFNNDAPECNLEFPKDDDIINYIEQDKRFNNIKGFVYCYAYAFADTKSIEPTKNLFNSPPFKRIFDDFTIAKNAEGVTFVDNSNYFQTEIERKLANQIISWLLANPRYFLKDGGTVTDSEKCKAIKEIAIEAEAPSKTKEGTELLMIFNAIDKTDVLKYQDLKSAIVLNFATFLYKIENFNNLIEFNTEKSVKFNQFSLGMWGAFNGFAILDKVIFESLFKDNALTTYLDNELEKTWNILQKESLITKEVKKLPPKNIKIPQQQNSQQSPPKNKNKPISTKNIGSNLPIEQQQSFVGDISFLTEENKRLSAAITNLGTKVFELKTILENQQHKISTLYEDIAKQAKQIELQATQIAEQINEIQQLEEAQTKQGSLISKILDWIKSFPNPFK